MAKQLNVNLKVSADTAAAQQALKGLSQSLIAIQNTSSAAFKNLNLDKQKVNKEYEEKNKVLMQQIEEIFLFLKNQEGLARLCIPPW